MILLVIIVSGIYSYYGPFFTLPTLFLSEATAAVGIAIINSVGNLGGVIGPYIIGLSNSVTGNSNGGFYGIAIFLLIAVLLLILLKKENQTRSSRY